MKMALSTLLILAAWPVFALVPDTTELTCSEARGFVSRNLVINMTSGTPKYTRYVAGANGEQCFGAEVAEEAFVPTLDDAKCAVGYICVESLEAVADSGLPDFRVR